VVKLDVSFFGVENVENITIIANGSITLKSDLVKIPNVRVENSNGVKIEPYKDPKKPVFTAELAFWSFVGLAGLITLISIILFFVGKFALPRREEFDVSNESSSAEGANKSSKKESVPD
jgi:hypothetical protein